MLSTRSLSPTGTRLGVIGTLGVDDIVLDKFYNYSMSLVSYVWSGKHHRVVKGVNLITLYSTDPSNQHMPMRPLNAKWLPIHPNCKLCPRNRNPLYKSHGAWMKFISKWRAVIAVCTVPSKRMERPSISFWTKNQRQKLPRPFIMLRRHWQALSFLIGCEKANIKIREKPHHGSIFTP